MWIAIHQRLKISSCVWLALGYEDTAAPENRLVTKRVPVDSYAKFLGFSGSSAGVASARTMAGY